MFSGSHGENIGDDCFAVRRFQTRAMRHAVEDVRPDEEISDLFRVAPLWKYKFMQHFYSRGNGWRDFIARTKRLDEFAFALGEIASFPYRFKMWHYKRG